MKKYVVVSGEPRSLICYYDCYSEAKALAERFCREYRDRYYVLKLISSCEIEETPIKWKKKW